MKKLFRKLFPTKEMRAYRKMYRRHRKELMKLAEDTREWSWGWLDDAVRIRIKHMHEYFSAGNNVWQTDETRLPIIEQLKHVLDLYDELDHLWDGESTDLDVICKREQELYEEIYSYIGCTLQHWWD